MARNNEHINVIQEGAKDENNQLLKTIGDKVYEVLEVQGSVDLLSHFTKVKCDSCT